MCSSWFLNNTFSELSFKFRLLEFYFKWSNKDHVFMTWPLNTNTHPFRSAGSEWYTCLPFSAMVRVPTCVVSLWLTRTGWNWLFDSVELDGKFIWLMGTLPFCSGVSSNGFLRTDSGVDVAMTLISGTVGGICFRQVWEWASCSFFIWRIATVALKACWSDEIMISDSQFRAGKNWS